MASVRCTTETIGIRRPQRNAAAWIVLVILVIIVAPAFPAANAALAASGTWYSAAASGAWQTTTNWNSGIVPGATTGTTNTDTATFNSPSSTTTIIPDANRNIENITFAGSAASYTIGATNGNALLLTAGGEIQIASTLGPSVNEFVSAPLTLEGNYSFACNASNTNNNALFLGGAVTSGVSGTQTLTVSGGGYLAADGAIGGGTGAIALVVNMGGGSILTLGGNNTFTGGLTIDAGAVSLASPCLTSVVVSPYVARTGF